jgi:hypothetical protein
VRIWLLLKDPDGHRTPERMAKDWAAGGMDFRLRWEEHDGFELPDVGNLQGRGNTPDSTWLWTEFHDRGDDVVIYLWKRQGRAYYDEWGDLIPGPPPSQMPRALIDRVLNGECIED